MTSQKLNKEHEILRRFMAVVVSSVFKNSLSAVKIAAATAENRAISVHSAMDVPISFSWAQGLCDGRRIEGQQIKGSRS